MPKKRNRIVLIFFLMGLAFCGWWIWTAYSTKRISFDLRQENVAKQFDLRANHWAHHPGEGLQLTCTEPCTIATPVIRSNWNEYPYIKIRIAESTVPTGRMQLIWANPDAADAIGYKQLVESAGTRIVSARSFQPWVRGVRWQGRIDRLGVIAVSGTVTISEISFADSLTPWEWVQLFANELHCVEPLLPYSINIFWGASVDGWSLTILAGCLAVLFLLIAIYGKGIRIGKVMAGLAFGLILLVDVPFLSTLVRTLREASTQSAWRTGKEEEDRSRFGPEYAELAQTLRQHAPFGSAVWIAQRQPDRIPVESSWLTFQLWPQYRTVSQIEEADYFLLLHSIEGRYDPAGWTFILPKHNPIKVNPLATIQSDVMLLKRQRD
jgi:hypothetical protein